MLIPISLALPVLLYYCRAFNSICHNLLLAKLKAYGLSESAIQLVRSYLCERKQRVKCNSTYSDWLPVRCGVPQGSLLGPLLFNIFINDINNTNLNISTLPLYADDTTQYGSVESPAALEFLLNKDTEVLAQWFSDNFLQVNASKTQAMSLGRSQYAYVFHLNNNIIQTENTLRILGVTLDKNLTFKPYVNEILKKIYAKIATLSRLKHFVPKYILVSLYKTYVVPHFEYCSPILLGISKTLKQKMESANEYGLRTILNAGSNCKYDELLNLASMQSLEQRRAIYSLSLVYKSVNGLAPQYISSFFKTRITKYNLRGNGLNVVQKAYNSSFMHRSFTYIVSHYWNNLNDSIRLSDSVSQFRDGISNVDFKGCTCSSCMS